MCSQDQVLPFPLPSKVVWHRGGFGQGRAPPLRAPKGSLDWSHRDADNLRGGNGRGSKGGTFLTRTKGDIIKVARHCESRSCVESRSCRVALSASRALCESRSPASRALPP